MENKPSVYIGISPSKQSLRIGEFRTHMYTYAYARHNNIPVYIKCDDTNPDSRVRSNFKKIIDEINRLGLKFSASELSYWENSIIYQSKNTELYKKFLLILEKMGVTSELNGLISLDFQKSINLIANNIQGGDILRRSTKFDLYNTGYKYIPLYLLSEDRFLFHLPCVVDEHIMGTTVSIRGEDKISLMPIHDVLRALLNFTKIQYLHLPLLLMPDSNKRVKGEQYSLKILLKKYPQNKLISYLLKSGYRLEGKNLIDLDQFISKFNITKIKKISSRFNDNLT